MHFDFAQYCKHSLKFSLGSNYKQKGSAHILLILGVVILGSLTLGYWYITKQTLPPVETAAGSDLKNKVLSAVNNAVKTEKIDNSVNTKTKTYINKELNFQLVNPDKDSAILQDSEDEFNKRGGGDFRKNFKGYIGYEPGKVLGAVVVLDQTSSYDKNPFSVWVFENPEDLTIDAWHHNFWYYPFVWGDFTSGGKFDLAPKEEATVSGQTGKGRVIDYQSGKPKFIYISKDKKMYLFRIIGSDGEKVLETFKFL